MNQQRPHICATTLEINHEFKICNSTTNFCITVSWSSEEHIAKIYPYEQVKAFSLAIELILIYQFRKDQSMCWRHLTGMRYKGNSHKYSKKLTK